MDHVTEIAGGSAAATEASGARTMAVMVTDVVGSTRLRDAVGDAEATELIVVASAIVANVVTVRGGLVRRRT
ncbi:MAG: hypothetical protein R3249_02360, partial [Nitriliruptorales bacterium]|nr:hypothetical protein [Nitriliruptorales bacterium]